MDTNFDTPKEFGITGVYSPNARQRDKVGFIYLRGCVREVMKTRYRLIRRGSRGGALRSVWS